MLALASMQVWIPCELVSEHEHTPVQEATVDNLAKNVVVTVLL